MTGQNSQNEDRFPDNIRKLIWKGFLSHTIKISDVRLTLKTLNEQEMLLIEEAATTPWRRNLLRVWYALAFVEDINVLRYRNDADIASQIMRIVFNFDRSFLNIVYRILNRLAKWYAYELKNVYRYCLTQESQVRWPICKGKILSDPALTLIPGTEHVGMSAHQQIWAKTQEEAEREEYSRMLFENTLFVSQAFSGDKGINNIRNRVRHHDEKRAKLNAQILEGHSQGRLDEINNLIDELERQVSGHKDEAELEIERQERNNIRKTIWDSIYPIVVSQERYRQMPAENVLNAIGDREITDQELAQTYQRKMEEMNKESIGAKIDLTDEQIMQLVTLMKRKAQHEVRKQLEEDPSQIQKLTSPPQFSPKPKSGRPEEQLLPPHLREARERQRQEEKLYEEQERDRLRNSGR
jgi:hypothetical protein